jgi:phosphoenolpyruvate carboxylase
MGELGQAEEHREGLVELHSLRISLIQFIYVKAMFVPKFSSRSNVALNDLIREILQLEVPGALSELRAIFPTHVDEDDDALYGEQSTYQSGKAFGYVREEEGIFAPIEEAYRLVLMISAILALKIGAFG